MKVTKTSEGVILTVSNLRELLSLDNVKYYEDPQTKLSSEIFRIDCDEMLELTPEEIAQKEEISADPSFVPELYDLTLYGKEIGNLGLAAYDTGLGYGCSTMIKVDLTYPEATKFHSLTFPIKFNFSFDGGTESQSNRISFDLTLSDDMQIYSSAAGDNPFSSSHFKAFDERDTGENLISICWNPTGQAYENDTMFAIKFKDSSFETYDVFLTSSINPSSFPNYKIEVSKDINSNFAQYNRQQINVFVAPKLDILPGNMFMYSPIKEFRGDTVKEIGYGAFYRSNVAHVYAPNVECIGELAFGDSLLAEVDFPKVEKIICQSEETTPFLHCHGISSFKMDGLKYCINIDADSWFFRMEPGQRFVWLRQHGYIYSPGAIATNYKEADYLSGLNLLANTVSKPIEISLKSYNCGKGNAKFTEDEVHKIFGNIPLEAVNLEYLYFKIGKDFWNHLENTESLNIQSMDTIPSNFVKDAKKLEDIVFSKNLECIYDSGFEGCSLLSGVVSFPKIDYIGRRAFANCKNITKAVLPKWIETIDSEAFAGCSNLTTVDGAECVSFYGRRAADANRVATDILSGTQVKSINYGDANYNPLQYKTSFDDTSIYDIFGKSILIESERKEAYSPFPLVPSIVIEPPIRLLAIPFTRYVIESSTGYENAKKIAIPMDQYYDYIEKCKNYQYPPNLDPSYHELFALQDTCRRIQQAVDAGEPISEHERIILSYKEDVDRYCSAMYYLSDGSGTIDKLSLYFVPVTEDGYSIFDLSSNITETTISYGKNKISKFETNKSDFFSFTPSFIESWELDPATEPVLSLYRVYDNDFDNRTSNIDFGAIDFGRKCSYVDMRVVVKDYNTGNTVWTSGTFRSNTAGETFTVNTSNQGSGKTYTVEVQGTNDKGLTSFAKLNYQATAYSRGSIDYVKVSSSNSTTLSIEFKLGKLPTDASGNPFNPNVYIAVKNSSGAVVNSSTTLSATTDKYTISLNNIPNNATYTIVATVKGSVDPYDASNTQSFTHKVTRNLVFTVENHYSGKEWRFNQSSEKTIEWPVGKKYSFTSDIATYNMTVNSYTTIYGFTKTLNSLTANYKLSDGITPSDSDTSNITLYPVPGRISIGYGTTRSETYEMETTTDPDKTKDDHDNVTGSLSGINTGLAQERTWYIRTAKLNISNVKSCSKASVELRDTNRSANGKDYVVILETGTDSKSGTDIAVQANSSGIINTWSAGHIYAERRKPVTCCMTVQTQLINGFYTYINK